MPRYQGTTTARGLGSQHQSARQRALAVMPEGALCARCEQAGIAHPMTRAAITRRPDGRYVAPLLDLDDFPGRAYGGPQVKRLSWARCNRRAGQRQTTAINRARGITPRMLAAIRWRQWQASAAAQRRQ
jgi:hypothetical protein